MKNILTKKYLIICGCALLVCLGYTVFRKGDVNTFSTAGILTGIVLLILGAGIAPARPGLPSGFSNGLNPAGHIMIAQEVDRAGGYHRNNAADSSFWNAGVTLLIISIILKVIF